jgi:AcrR family transcriptional regulator
MKTSTVTRLPVKAPSARPKGQQTKAAIVDAALHMAAQVGLEGLSIGLLADNLQMSKSGVFAHFGSREELQMSVVREYHARFEQDVFMPAMQAKRGLPRLRALFDHWMKRTSEEIDSGCIYISGAVEFDDQPGPVRDELVRSVRAWIDAVITAIDMAIDEGHLQANTDARQVGFEIHGLILALHYEARLLRDPKATQRAHKAFEAILARHSTKALTVARRKTKT